MSSQSTASSYSRTRFSGGEVDGAPRLSQIPVHSCPMAQQATSASTELFETGGALENIHLEDARSLMSFDSNSTSTSTIVGSVSTLQPFRESVVTLTSQPVHESRLAPEASSERCVLSIPKMFKGEGVQGRPCATLYLHNPGLGSRFHRPRYSGVDHIAGTVELSLALPQSVKHIKLTLKGTMRTDNTVNGGFVKILDHSFDIWDCKQGDPRHSKSTSPSERKLQGDVIFPFTFPFPTHVDLSTLSAVSGSSDPAASFSEQSEPSASSSSPRSSTADPSSSSEPEKSKRWSLFNRKPKSKTPSPRSSRGSQDPIEEGQATMRDAIFELPPSFLEQGINTSIYYKLYLVITHTALSDSRSSIPITYAPLFYPPPSPVLRQIAYTNGAMMPGPNVDPSGWHRLPTVSIQGTFLDQYSLTIDCTLFLASPLSYPSGTIIPCYLLIACLNSNALDLTSDPRSPRVILRRSIRFLGTASPTDPTTGMNVNHFALGATGGATPTSPSLSAWTIVQNARKSSARAKAQRRAGGWRGKAHVEVEIEKDLNGGEFEKGDTNPYEDDLVLDHQEEVKSTVETGAVWWEPAKDEDEEDGKEDCEDDREEKCRLLQGEIHLPKDMIASCSFPLFRVKYMVELLVPLSAGAFVANPPPPVESAWDKGKPPSRGKRDSGGSSSSQSGLDGDAVYASQVVEITSSPRNDEPIPTPYATIVRRS